MLGELFACVWSTVGVLEEVIVVNDIVGDGVSCPDVASVALV